MTVKQLYDFLDSRIPKELSCDWDNDGLMCCPCPDREAKSVLVALDATAEAVGKAIDGGYDCIVTHHPFIFKGLKAINTENYIADKAIQLIREGISVLSFHTRLDALDGGVNDRLVEMLGLKDIEPFAEGIGRIGTLRECMTAEQLAVKVKSMLCADGVFLADALRTPNRVAVLGGGGDGDIAEAMAMGADTYISGDFGYHSKTDAPDMGINLIEAGHFQTEAPVCTVLRDMILSADSTIQCDIFNSNRTKLI